MKTSTYTLFEQLGLVFETHCPDEVFFLAEESGGRRVGEKAPDLAEMAVSLCFVLPPLGFEPGTYNVINVARVSREPEPRPDDQGGDISLSVTYDAVNATFVVRLAAGEGSEVYREIRLESLPLTTVAQRVLRLLVIVNRDAIYASLDSEDGKGEIGVYGDAPSCGAALDPWSRPDAVLPPGSPGGAAGLWRVTSGAVTSSDESMLAFPPGFGLSDVQILVLGESGEGNRQLVYSGALDHLTGWSAKWDVLRRTERLFEEELTDLAGEVRSVASGLESWVVRTHRAADRAEDLAQLHLASVDAIEDC